MHRYLGSLPGFLFCGRDVLIRATDVVDDSSCGAEVFVMVGNGFIFC